VKFPALFTVRATSVVLVRRPDAPVMVIFAVPMAAELLAANVTVLMLFVPTGLKEAVTPLGTPEADRVTMLEKPFCGITVTVLVPVLPRVMLTLLGEEDREKPGIGPWLGQLITRFVALRVPMPVAKSQPVVAPYAGAKELLDVESTP
jgi:hypothetical protein